MSQMLHFGNDLGAGANKLFGPAGGVQLLSTVAADDGRVLARMPGLTRRRPPLRISTEAGAFYVGAGAHDWGRPIENLDFDRFSGSPELVALFCGTFSRYVNQHGPVQFPVHLTVGLPLEALSGAPEQVAATISGVRRWLRREHAWEANGRPFSITVHEVGITSQPVGGAVRSPPR